ncbi:MAG: FtsX-like permease family protein [Pseudomonadota bacterium]
MTSFALFWSLSWRQLVRDARAGELRLLMLAVALAVAALTAVSFFADRLNSGLARDARQLLGGDVVLVSDQPLPESFLNEARERELRVTQTLGFPSMARAPDERGGASRLVAVKAVGEGYPLRGRLKVQSAVGQDGEAVANGPPPGRVWVEAAVLDALGLQVGDSVLLGEAQLQVDRLILHEPDRGAGFMSFSPRVMLHSADLAATQLVQPASRVRYRLAVASPGADDAVVKRYQRWAEQQVETLSLRNVQVESLDAGRPEMQQTLDRAGKFLNLVALLAALLSAVAVAIASRDFALRHLDDCAMLRVLGQSQGRIAAQYAVEFALAGVVASLAGVALGFAVHYGFIALLANLLTTELPPASWWPAGFGIGVGLTLLVGFGLPPVLQLARVPPLRVIRREVGGLKPASVTVLLAGVLGFVALLLAVANDITLGLIAVGGFAGAVMVFALLGWISVEVLRRAVPESRAPRWLILATRQIASRPAYAVLQVCALSVGLLALVLLILLRTDLIDSWRQATPPDAPNRFVINIQPDQAEAFQAHLRSQGVAQYDWYPMIRSRLVAVNERTVNADQYTNQRAKNLVDREFNLSHAPALPDSNEVTEGQWVPEEPGALSVDEGLAEELGLKLGDTLRFDTAGQITQGKITSLRKIDWGSMRVNFFVMLPVTTWPESVPTYVVAFRAPETPGFDNTLSRTFPNVTNVDVSASIAQVQGVLGQVIRAVEFLFGFTLATGLVVLFAAVSATRESRAREFAVMRALGASSSLLAKVQRAELLGVGTLAGVLASLAATAVGWGLARYVFEFDWNPSPWVPVLGALAGALLALAAGWWGLREVLRRPVVETLRQAAQD